MKHQNHQITKFTVVLMVFAAMLFLQQDVNAQCNLITYDETTGDQIITELPCDFPLGLFPPTMRGVEQDKNNPPVEPTENEILQEQEAMRVWARLHPVEYELITNLLNTEDAVFHVAVTPAFIDALPNARQSSILTDTRFVVIQ